jgi:hypothetical protein
MRRNYFDHNVFSSRLSSIPDTCQQRWPKHTEVPFVANQHDRDGLRSSILRNRFETDGVSNRGARYLADERSQN